MKNYYLGLIIGSLITLEGIIIESNLLWFIVVTITAFIGGSISYWLGDK